MKKLLSRLLLILMIFSLTFGSTGIKMTKATEDKIEEETSVVLESNTELYETDVTDVTEETEFHDNYLEDNEINGPSYAKNSLENASGVKEITQGKINPIVVLIDFPESEGDASSGKINLNSTYSENELSTIESSLSGSSESMKDYVSMVSGGKCVVNPYYAYNINNNVYVYTADHTKEYYMPYSETSNPIGYKSSEKYTRTELLIDAFAAIKDYIPKDLDVDTDDDGYIDAVDFFVNYETEWNSFLWPHKWCVFGDVEKTEVNGAVLDEYNLHTSDHIKSEKYRVASHEFMHLLGFPDMYVYGGSGAFKDPVGKWSMMAANTGYPTVWERIRYGGWISENDIPTISQNGIYTIKGSTLDSKKNTIAYKVSIPGSDEFFMIEYREKTANVYEEKIPATGIIVYRVDPNSEGNSSGNPEIYILRNPGYVSFGGYLCGKKGQESFELKLSSGESTGYVVEYLSNTNGQAQFILRKNTIEISSFESSLGSSLKVGDTTDLTINATSKSGSLKYTLDVNGNYLLKDSTSNTVKWAPSEDGTYKITAKAIDNENNITTKTTTIKVTDPNKTVIYYKGYDNPYIHYKVGDGSWTTPPGVKMTSSNDVDGFYYKAEINLKGSETLTACFNDGNGNWQSNSGENYNFGAGYYTFNNGSIRKISKPVAKIAISSFTVNPSSETTVSRFVTLSGEVKNNEGEVTYT